MEKKIIVTGASGFIGNYVVKKLISSGHEVVPLYHSKEVFFHGAEAISCNLADKNMVEKLKNQPGIESVDTVIHIAGLVRGKADHWSFIDTNVNGTKNLVDFCKEINVKRMIYFSTYGVYGKNNLEMVNEASDIINPETYETTKLLGEKLVREAGFNQNISLRIPSTIGIGAQPELWLPKTVGQLLENKPVTFYNKDQQYNLTAHVSDLANFILFLLKKEQWEEVVNFSVRDSISIQELLFYLKDKLNSQSKLEDMGEKKFGIYGIDNARLLKMGYQPMSLLETLELYCDEIKEKGNSYDN